MVRAPPRVSEGRHSAGFQGTHIFGAVTRGEPCFEDVIYFAMSSRSLLYGGEACLTFRYVPCRRVAFVLLLGLFAC